MPNPSPVLTPPEPVPADPTPSLLRTARNQLQSGKYADALQTAQALVQLHPENGSYQFLLGEAAFMAGEMTQSIGAFDALIRIEPQSQARLWQRGLALYYADEFEKGVEQFEIHQTVNSQDVENAVWHMLCSARLIGVDQAREQLIPIRRDSRIPMKEIFQLFSGQLSPEDVIDAAEDAAGQNESEKQASLYYAYLYIGLFYEMTGDAEKSAGAINRAAALHPFPNNNLMGRVAAVHILMRAKRMEKETHDPTK